MKADERLRPVTAAELEAAAGWHVRLAECADAVPEQEALRFRQWLAASTSHLRAYEQVQRSMNLVLEPIVAAPLERAFEGPSIDPTPLHELRRWTAWPRMAAALVGTIAATAFALGLVGQGAGKTEWQRVTTLVGERKIIRLEDGSQLSLDQNTALDIGFTGKSRHVKLEKGQARFAVAHDAARPFIVSAGSRTVTALGTEFNVERTGRDLSVFLLQGKVAIAPIDEQTAEAHPEQAIERATHTLTPGNQLSLYSDGRTVLRRGVGWQEAFAWQEGRLSLNGNRLGDAVARLNRYQPPTMRIDDPDVSAMRISGVFDLTHREGFLEALTTLLPVHVRAEAGVIYITCRKPGACRKVR